MKQLILDRFSKAQTTYDDHALAQKEIAFRLSELVLGEVSQDSFCKSMLEIGCGTGLLTRALLPHFAFEKVHLNDISKTFEPLFSDLNEQYDFRFYAEDAEKAEFGGTYDLIVSSSVFQWFDDIPVFLKKIRQFLSPGGLFAFSTFGQENMKEIRILTGNGLVYFSKKEWDKMLSVHFELMKTDEKLIEIRLDSPKEVLKHLKQTGVNAFKLEKTIWTPAKMSRFDAAYRNLFSIGGQVKLTYHPLYFIARLKK
ncbi:MAG: malonyl-ACP O-methyltransferase BioC [Prevotellaceae bacterium]|jgi:malonyl-CoA O-methyltransferase|nr:malonyl-ACP O-methyltransferase BioC [Prevotellaceae bacterium]